MKLIVKLLSWIVLFIVVVAIAFVVLFDPNEYKQEIQQQVYEATKRDLAIQGDIGLSLIPVGLELGQVELSNAEGFEQPVFARIESLVIKVKLFPLLAQRLEVDALSLSGLWLFLEVDEQGHSNWADLATADEAPTPQEPAEDPDAQSREEDADSGKPPLAALAVNGIEIDDAEIQFDDRKQGSQIRISEFNLNTSEIEFGEAFDISMFAHVSQKQQQKEQAATIDLRGAVTVQQNLKQFRLDDLIVAVKAKLPDVHKDVLELGLQLGAAIDLDAEAVSVKDMNIDALYNKFVLNTDISNWSQELQVKGALASETINLRELAYRFAAELPSMQGENTLSALSFTVPFSLIGSQLRAEPDIRFDDSKIDADLSVALDTQAVRYKLAIDSIDLNRYMPPPAAEDVVAASDAPAVEPEPAQEQDLPIPVELIRSLDIEGDLTIGSARLLEYELQNISVHTSVADGFARLEPVELDVLDGHVTVNTVMDVNKDVPVFTTRLNASSLHIAQIADPIIADLITTQQISTQGKGDVTADVRTHGLRVSRIKNNLNGKAAYRFDGIRFDGLDADHLVKTEIKKIADEKGIPLDPNYAGTYRPENETAFDIAKANFDIRWGVASTSDLLLDSRKLRLSAKGKVDINKMAVDMRTVTDMKVAKPKTAADKLRDAPLPVHVFGPVAALQFEPDYGPLKKVAKDLVKAKVKKKVDKKVDAAKQKLDNKVEEKKQEARDKLKDKLENKLKGLFR